MKAPPRSPEQIEFGIHKIIAEDKRRKRLLRDMDSKPLVSIGPSGIGGPFQTELHSVSPLRPCALRTRRVGFFT